MPERSIRSLYTETCMENKAVFFLAVVYFSRCFVSWLFLGALSVAGLSLPFGLCGSPCGPRRRPKMPNWQGNFNIFYLGNERNSEQLRRQ